MEKPLICIVGQTASGKSALAVKIARAWDGEIICADSWTVRKQANIGTAKPSEVDRALVRHHLLDIIEPDEDFNAAQFQKLAKRIITDIQKRGKLPVLVGGTGLYIDSVLYDYSFSSVGTPVQREELNSLTISQLLSRINDLGIDVGAVDVRNKRRLVRLVETGGAIPTKHRLRSNTLLLGMLVDPEVLNRRIVQRLESMINEGLEKEVLGLYQQYGWDCEALKGINYAQWKGYFLGTESIDDVRQKMIKATRDLAKRQKTWFKRNKSIQWLNNPVEWNIVVDLVTTYLNTDIS